MNPTPQTTNASAATTAHRTNMDSADNLTTHGLKVSLRAGKYTWPGGYPCYFITSDDAVLSFEAVRANFRAVLSSIRDKQSDGWRVVAVDVNYEDPALYCDHTGERIESAYAEI